MPEHVIRRGLDLPIAGAATGSVESLPFPSKISVDPREFRGLVPRLAAREGDVVRAGDPLFYNKQRPEQRYLSPVSGRVTAIERGERRVITGVVVETDGANAAANFPIWDLGRLAGISRDQAKAQLLEGGFWWSIRQRPLGILANPDDVPQSIVVCATDSGPLQPGATELLASDAKEFVQAGILVLKSLTAGAVYLMTKAGSPHPALTGLAGVDEHSFRGPHPSGDVAVQINHVCPPKGNGKVWYIYAWDLARVGELFLRGRYTGQKVVAVVGTGAARNRLVRTVLGASLAAVAGDVKPGPIRWIRGSVLTGATASPEQSVGWYHNALHLLPEEVPRRLFGWMMPSFGTYSVHRSFLAGWTGGSGLDLRPGVFGGHRGLVPTGQYRSVVASPDIEPEFLMKALAAGDLEESIKLGLLDLSDEEAALCTYVCPSKIEFDVLLRQGLASYEKEM
jgi:Na+-transporting NADH:ubiquinone oxidoreductase subunit A